MQLKSWFGLSILTATMLLTSIAPAKANSTCDRNSDPDQAQTCTYSDRQRYLAEAISQIVYLYYQRTGQAIPVTSQTVVEVMRIVGASGSEAAFVVDRMVANARALSAPL
ncbi:MAG: hypothetical protein J0L70_30370 [Leptolyngbya sp. UWPOB_LEPTO1]|uniref:hypothetical protein n=1 Tax=Leptolyngbya sp. UWPOB_LEPTO1 TaxID=2815653 RepID=UPI001AD34C95|nr:hypothetical protein [Leptolyngbya sp. UWPOB_LEPTO1]MBN8564841.1 hypothetical protein [Leptolyngbya sp. UWPOB_LEPTO1]